MTKFVVISFTTNRSRRSCKMDFNLRTLCLLCVMLWTVLPILTEGTAGFGQGGMSFGFTPGPDTDADDDDDDNSDDSTDPPLGFVGFGNGRMHLSFNTPSESESDSDSPDTPSTVQPGVDFREKFGCCPSLDKKTKRQNKKNCGPDDKDECIHDLFCDTVKKCCFDGCRKTCMKSTKTCTNNKKWRNDFKVQVDGKTVKCNNCGCDKLVEKDFKSPGFLLKLCKENIKQVAKKCCKLCELRHNLGFREPC